MLLDRGKEKRKDALRVFSQRFSFRIESYKAIKKMIKGKSTHPIVSPNVGIIVTPLSRCARQRTGFGLAIQAQALRRNTDKFHLGIALLRLRY